MAKRLPIHKIKQIRNDYFLYVYKKHVYNIFNNYDMTKSEQIYLGRKRHYECPEILKEYITSKIFNKSEIEVLCTIQHDIHGLMNVFEDNDDYLMVYNQNDDKLYQVTPNTLSKNKIDYNSFYYKIDACLITVYGEIYFDYIEYTKEEKLSINKIEKLYEHVYSIAKKQNVISKIDCFTTRELRREDLYDSFYSIFIDYFSVIFELGLPDQENCDLLDIAVYAWNNPYSDYKINLSLFKNQRMVKYFVKRREQYFSNINIVILEHKLNQINDSYNIYMNIIEA